MQGLPVAGAITIVILFAFLLHVAPQLTVELNKTNTVVENVVNYGLNGLDNITNNRNIMGSPPLERSLNNLTKEYNNTLREVKNGLPKISLPEPQNNTVNCSLIKYSNDGHVIQVNGSIGTGKIHELWRLANIHKGTTYIYYNETDATLILWKNQTIIVIYCHISTQKNSI